MALNLQGYGGPFSGVAEAMARGHSIYQQKMARELQKQQLAQQAAHWQEQMQLERERLSRMGRNDDLQRQMLMMQMQKMKHDMDPMAKWNDFQKIQQLITGGEKGEGQESPQAEFGQGMGMFTPEGMQEAQKLQGGEQSGNMFEAMKNNPALRGFFKQQFGYDPLNMPQTPEEKQQLAIEKAKQEALITSNQKKTDELESSARALMPFAKDAKTILDILKKKPDLTGNLTGLAHKINLTKDEDVAKFATAAQNLQASMVQKLGSRGGYGLSRIVEGVKPGISKSGSYNKGATKQLLQTMVDSFEEMQKEYKRLNGKDLPFDFKEFKDALEEKAPTEKQNQKRWKFNQSTGRLE